MTEVQRSSILCPSTLLGLALVAAIVAVIAVLLLRALP